MKFIDLESQYLQYKDETDKAVLAVLKHGQYIMGPEVKELEQKLAAYVGVKHCITVASGTDALLIALMAYGIGAGDEVITVPFTWISTAEVISLLGAKPVFVDVEPDSYNIDLDQLEAAITPRTKAIIPVNLFGQMPDYAKMKAIALRHGIPVIEDAAQSFGATQQGQKSCSVADIGCASFFPAKPLGCYGDGGALFTNDDALAAKMRAIRTHGGEVRHMHTCIGLNGRFDTIQAAVVLVKLRHFDDELAARCAVAARYDAALNECCLIPLVASGNTHVYAQYTIRVNDRDGLAKALKDAGIPTGIYYPKCLHEQPCFSYLGYHSGSFPVSEKMSREVISLPMHPWLTEGQQRKICELVRQHAVRPAPIQVSESVQPDMKPPYVHPTAIVDPGAQIGAGAKIWHFCHIMSGAVIGPECNLGQNVVVSPDVRLGYRVKVQNNVSLYTGVICEEDVFIGPSAVFTNVINPRSAVVRKNEYKATHVRRGATIGANATIVCGIELGAYCFVGAGSVVTKDVKPFALVYGNPATQVGWMSRHGDRLDLPTHTRNGTIQRARCPSTDEEYILEGAELILATTEMMANR